MNNASSLKSNNTYSPKTPGGISKSLLTPCRRLGLSRNWKKKGPSPFISPLSNTSVEVKEEKQETRKRKERVPEENISATPIDENELQNTNNTSVQAQNIDITPSRNIEVPRRKKSKTLLSDINNSQEEISKITSKNSTSSIVDEPLSVDSHNNENKEVISTPVRTTSKRGKIRISPLKRSPKELKVNKKKNGVSENISTPENVIYTIKEKSPNDLKKECIVVLQKKIFKNVINNDDKSQVTNRKNEKQIDSDSDEVPLINFHKQNSINNEIKPIANDDDDFIDNKSLKVKPSNKIKDTKSPKNKPKNTKPAKSRIEKVIVDKKLPAPSQSCFDDDDDDFDNKKTILIKKTYEKVSKPIKAKSTGSITQRDIDDLRQRIEAKKKLLLAQSLTPDTEELRSLIKKWQKGCQNALMELLDLMKSKFPDKEKMDYSEMLRTLKIPASLVGYDSDNDCFVSPDDASIVLGQFKDI